MNLADFIANSSSSQIESCFKDLKADYFPLDLLIDPLNPLAYDTLGTLVDYQKDRINPGTINHTVHNNSYLLHFQDASTYLSASTLLHCFDGWSYLSRAADALMNGDTGIAIHLAYYAELRASMSFLATEGIGVFNDLHLIIKDDRSFVVQDKLAGTHTFVWSAIQQWSISPTTNSLKLLQIFSVEGNTFDKWALAFHPRITAVMSGTVIQDWLRKWNLDVKAFQNDKNARNEMSYRPQRLNKFTQNQLDETTARIFEFWNIFEPNPAQQFGLLDKYLLAFFLQDLYKILLAQDPTIKPFEKLIEEAIDGLGVSRSKSLEDILLGTSVNTLITESRKPCIDNQNGIINPIAILARATLVLRLSTGKVSNILKQASITQSDLKFWFDKVGLDNGFWKPNAYPPAFYSLWEEIQESKEELSDWLDDNGASLNLATLNEQMSDQLALLKQFHRVGFWGLNI